MTSEVTERQIEEILDRFGATDRLVETGAYGDGDDTGHASPSFRVGEWNDGAMPCFYILGDEAEAFVMACYENGFVTNFDWMSWKDRAERLIEEPESVARLGLAEIRDGKLDRIEERANVRIHMGGMKETGG